MQQQTELHTAEELYQFSCAHNFGTGFGTAWGKKNFRLIERALAPEERVLLTFVGLHRFRSMSYHQRNFAYAITDRRILMMQKRSFGRTRMEIIPLEAVQNISFDADSTIGVMKIMLAEESVTIGMRQDCAQALQAALTELLPQLQEYARQLSGAPQTDE